MKKESWKGFIASPPVDFRDENDDHVTLVRNLGIRIASTAHSNFVFSNQPVPYSIPNPLPKTSHPKAAFPYSAQSYPRTL